MVDSAGGVSNTPSQINLTGNIKDPKMKTVSSGEGDKKTTSVFVESVKVYASDDTNQNGKVNGGEIKSGKNASIFNNSNLSGENVKNNAFSKLDATGQQIANTKSQNTLNEIKSKFAKAFDKFNIKVGGDKLQSNGNSGVGQSEIDSKIAAYDSQVTSAATSHANETNQKILQAYSEALSEIAKEADAEAAKQKEQEAINKDLSGSKTDDTPTSTPEGGITPSLGKMKGIGDGMFGEIKLTKPTAPEPKFDNPAVDEKPEVKSDDDGGKDVKNEVKTKKKTVYSLHKAPAAKQGQKQVTLQAGQTLSSLSQQHGMSLQEFAKLNNLTDLNHFQAGSTFLVKDSGNKTATKTDKTAAASEGKVRSDQAQINQWNKANPNKKITVNGDKLQTTLSYKGKKVVVKANSFNGLKGLVSKTMKDIDNEIAKNKKNESQRYAYTQTAWKNSNSYAALGRAMQH